MSEQDLEVIREQFDATNRGDFERAMELYSDDVVAISPRDWPVSGTFRGKEAVGEWFGDWFRVFGETWFELEEMREGEERIAVTARNTARGRGSGAVVEQRFFYAYTVSDGKITGVEFFKSWEEALIAVGLPSD